MRRNAPYLVGHCVPIPKLPRRARTSFPRLLLEEVPIGEGRGHLGSSFAVRAAAAACCSVVEQP